MEKIIRSVNALKSIYGELVIEDKVSKDASQIPKDCQLYCITIADSIISTAVKNSNDFPALLAISIEILLQACSDDNADVRLTAEESLNRLIKGLYETNISKILVELYKDIKKNGHPRSLRASLSRFSDLCFSIRPGKCRPYILNLLPCLSRISQREEESIQECLAAAITKIFNSLGSFASESEVQGLIASFLKNLSHNSVTVRRTAGTCLHSIVANSRKIDSVLLPLAKSIIDILSQRNEDRFTILGSLQSLRAISPLLLCNNIKDYNEIIIKMFELTVHYSCHGDHTITTAALELLEQLLKLLPSQMSDFLLGFKELIPPLFVATQQTTELKNPVTEEQVNNDGTDGSSIHNTQSEVLSDVATSMSPPSNDVDLEDSLSEPLSANNEKLNVAIDNNEELSSNETSLLHHSSGEFDHSRNNKSNNEEVNILSPSDVYKVGVVDITDIQALPVLNLAKMLCQRFLLSPEVGSLISDAKVRVSTKTLTLSCLSHLIKLFPLTFCAKLFNNQNEVVMNDACLYRSHSDPKLKGAALHLAAVFLDCVVLSSRSGKLSDWFDKMKEIYPEAALLSCPDVADLIEMLKSGLTNESTTCVRQTCSSIALCLHGLLESSYYHHGLTLLRSITSLRSNTYWLLRVDVLDIMASLNYRQIHYLEATLLSSSDFVPRKCFQDECLEITLESLSEDDPRIRKAAAEALLAFVATYSPKSKLNKEVVSLETFELCRCHLGAGLLGNSDDAVQSSRLSDLVSDKNLLKTHRGFNGDSPIRILNENLSLIIGEISLLLSRSTSKHQTIGCILSLKILSDNYSPCSYPSAWGLHFTLSDDNKRSRSESSISRNTADGSSEQDEVQQSGILPLIMGLIRSSWLPLEIAAHCDALILAGNLLAGAASHGFQVVGVKSGEQSDKPKPPSKTGAPGWSSLNDDVIGLYSCDLFTHLMKLLAISHHVISDTSPVSSNKSVLPNLSSNASIPSPMKRKDKSKDGSSDAAKSSPTLPRKLLPSPSPKPNPVKEDADKEKPTKKILGSFSQSRVHMKLYEQLLGSYKNYKGSLEFGDGDRFCSFLQTVLDVTCQMMELATFSDIGGHTEEILSYLKSTFSPEPSTSIQCVQQLLKALFGTNLVHQLDSVNEAKSRSPVKTQSLSGMEFNSTLSHQIFQHPLNHLTMSIANSSFHHSLQSESDKENPGWFSSVKKKMEEKLNQSSKSSKSNKSSIQNHIRLFESLVIRSLKLYTATSSVQFQKYVLNLLAQLVQLRVNYCMLDSDQVFINFIIKQFESIEGGLIRGSESLVPHVFFFLVLLSYEKYHSKSVITMPKIIQLCAGLMASGRDSTSHVIPALEPIVHDLFVVRASTKHDIKEVLTQREVVFSILLKLVQHPQVFEMVTTVLHHSRRDNIDKWKMISRQIADVLLPLLDKLQMELSCHNDISNMHSLFQALSPSSLRPTELILEIMLALPDDITSVNVLHRWLGKILILLRVLICNIKEGDLTDALERSRLCFHFEKLALSSATSSSVMSDSSSIHLFARFFHEVIAFTTRHLAGVLSTPTARWSKPSEILVCREIIELMHHLNFIYRAGTYKTLTTASCQLMRDVSAHVTSSSTMLSQVLMIGRTYPIVATTWLQWITQMGYIDLNLWGGLIGSIGADESSPTINHRIITTGAVVLLCDYAFGLDETNFLKSHRKQLFLSIMSQNIQPPDVTSWLVERSVHDIIELSGEPPVQDFLSVIQQAREVTWFISSLTTYCSKKDNIKGEFMRKSIDVLRGFVDVCALPLLQLLVTRHFLFSKLVAISRSCDQLGCSCAESMLARYSAEEVDRNVSLENIVLITDSFTPAHQKRFARLYALLMKLKCHVTGDEPIRSFVSSPQLNVNELLEPPSKDWFKAILISSCENGRWTPECAKALACSEYDEIMDIMLNKAFRASYLEVCIAFGISEAILLRNEMKPYPEELLSSLMKASLDKLQLFIDSIIESYEALPSSDYSAHLRGFCEDEESRHILSSLCRCVVRVLFADSALPPHYKLPRSSYRNILQVAVLHCEMVDWQLRHGSSLSLGVTTTCLEVIQQTLQISEIRLILCDPTNTTWVMRITDAMYSLTCSYVGELPFHPPYLPQCIASQQSHSMECCIRLSRLFHLLQDSEEVNNLPGSLSDTLYNIVIQLCCTPLFNSYIRIPTVLWKYGWNPTPEGKDRTLFPEIPPVYMKEKEVLNDFSRIINRIGWTNRTQFEESWACLLGVLVSQPLTETLSEEDENEDSIEISCLAIRGLTSLVISCSLQPHSGQTATSLYRTYNRHSSFKLGHTRMGKQLMGVRSIIEEELTAMTTPTSHLSTHHYYQHFSSVGMETIQQQLTRNTERVMTSPLTYGLGQCSIRFFRDLHGITPLNDESDFSSDEDVDVSPVKSSDLSVRSEDSDGSDVFDQSSRPRDGSIPISPLKVRDGVDVHSCVQFLLDLYTQWFRTTAQATSSSSMARPLVCECVRSLLLISDLFTERQQFEWMFQSLTQLHGSQPSDDDIMLQYIVTSMCKSGAVLGLGGNICEVVGPVIETALSSQLMSCRIAALYGALYCIECYPNKHIHVITDIIVRFVPNAMVVVSTCPPLHNEEYVIALTSLAFFFIEKCSDIVTPEFISVIIQACNLILSSHDPAPSRVYHSVTLGLERLVMCFALSSAECEVLIKTAAEQLQSNPVLSRATVACSLMLTCMYCGRMRVTTQPDQSDASEGSTEHDSAIESKLLAMERLSILFDRIRKGQAKDARVMVRILPRVLDDFASPQDSMNKVIAEFISTLQPFPGMIAQALHQVFQNLCNRDETQLVREWVMLSLSNAIQRTPLSTAVWCLTCLFVSASTNHWITSLLPVVISRLNSSDEDWSYFCKAAVDFYKCQLTEELDRRSFHSVFSTASSQAPYKLLLDCIASINGERGIML